MWKKMDDAPWDREVLLTGDSGYGGSHSRFYVNGYRLKDWHRGEWNDPTGTQLSDNGWVPDGWMEIEELER